MNILTEKCNLHLIYPKNNIHLPKKWSLVIICYEHFNIIRIIQSLNIFNVYILEVNWRKLSFIQRALLFVSSANSYPKAGTNESKWH